MSHCLKDLLEQTPYDVDSRSLLVKYLMQIPVRGVHNDGVLAEVDILENCLHA